MAEFVSLDEQETSIIPDHTYSLSNITPDTQIIDGVIENKEVDGICADYGIITISNINSAEIPEDDTEHICIKDNCDVSKYYGCPSPTNGFQKDNLFSELTDNYQRTIARMNLGISDIYAMKWGNIGGNLSNQKDLYTFVTDSIAFDVNKVIDEINLKLAQWACEIENRLENKANIFSPNFAGLPTTTLPLLTDNSNRIASTQWVNAKIESAVIADNISALAIEPEYMYYGDDPVDVVVSWNYSKEVEEQSINDTIISPNIRQYTFGGVTSSLVITLRYTLNGASSSRVITFKAKYPIYYGTSPDYTANNKTIDNTFNITTATGQYMYVMIPNGVSATLLVSSIIGGFVLLGTQSIFNNVYYVYRSTNTGLGTCTVEVVNQGNYETDTLNATTIMELLNTKADKYSVYSKIEVDNMLVSIIYGTSLVNYYTKSQTLALIPDISVKADITSVPTRVSQLLNDSNYLSSIPNEYITETELTAKGYLTTEIEPLFIASASYNILQSNIDSWNNKVDKVAGMGLSQQSFTTTEKAKLGSLYNYNDTELRGYITTINSTLLTKADKSEIPDISNLALKTEIPVNVSELTNDSGYLNSLPTNLVTIEELNSRAYLTSYIETDPTVPSWAKQATKPSYTLEELGAESSGAAAQALLDAKAYTDQQLGTILSGADPLYNTFLKVGNAILMQADSISSINTSISNINSTLLTKADKSELFSKSYNDLTDTPTIPSLTGYATETYVQSAITTAAPDLNIYALKTEIPDISTKVDKIVGMGLSTNDFTNVLKAKLDSLSNYNDTALIESILTLQYMTCTISNDMLISTTPSSYFATFDEAVTFMELLLDCHQVYIEYNDGFLVSYRKVVVDTSVDDEGHKVVTITAHYDSTQDVEMEFTFITGTTESFTYTKTFITRIIDNCTTNDSTTALSAAQGKILMDRIIALETTVNG